MGSEFDLGIVSLAVWMGTALYFLLKKDKSGRLTLIKDAVTMAVQATQQNPEWRNYNPEQKKATAVVFAQALLAEAGVKVDKHIVALAVEAAVKGMKMIDHEWTENIINKSETEFLGE